MTSAARTECRHLLGNALNHQQMVLEEIPAVSSASAETSVSSQHRENQKLYQQDQCPKHCPAKLSPPNHTAQRPPRFTVTKVKELQKHKEELDEIPEIEEENMEEKPRFTINSVSGKVRKHSLGHLQTFDLGKRFQERKKSTDTQVEDDFPSEESGVGSQCSQSVGGYSDCLDGVIISPMPSQIKPVCDKRSTTLAHRGRLFAGRQRRRLVEKNGECNVEYTKIKKRKIHFLLDFFTTIVEIRWRYILAMFFASFVVTWVGFGLLWWAIAVGHHDNERKQNSSDKVVPCVDGVKDFTTAFLFSLETMHTIGYGTRAMTDECVSAMLLLVLQACFGVIVQCIMTGIVLAKIARPKGRGSTIMFSKNAVINKSIDGKLCLKFRVADMRKSQLISSTIRAIFVEKCVSDDGEAMPMSQQNFPIVAETGSDLLFLSWPITILHYIDEKSPLFDLSAEKILSARFEIIVIMEGTIESTGMAAQVRTSYLPSEILWGHKLSPLVSYKKDGKYMIDHTKFHCTETLNISENCARDQNETVDLLSNSNVCRINIDGPDLDSSGNI